MAQRWAHKERQDQLRLEEERAFRREMLAIMSGKAAATPASAPAPSIELLDDESDLDDMTEEELRAALRKERRRGRDKTL